VLDDQHRVTGFDQRVQYVEELSHIVGNAALSLARRGCRGCGR
jgi:hypothetical protein